MLTALIGPIANLAGTWLEGKVEKTKPRQGPKVAIAKAEATIMEKKATGELRMGLGNGTRKPVIVERRVAGHFVFGAPDPCVHTGHGRVVANGFEQLKAMPQWYQYSLGVIVAASFGVRSATKFFGKK